MSLNLHRQLDFFNPELVDIPPVTVIGAGGIGSFVIPSLVQMGIEDITVFDRDKVEEHNIPNQNFLLEHLGQWKVDALKDFVARKTGIEITTKNRFFHEGSLIKEGIVISAVDSIDTRSMIFNKIKEQDGVTRFLDGRLGGEMFRTFNIDMKNDADIEHYEAELFPSEEAEDLPCTGKAVIYVANMIAGEMTHQVKLAITNPELCTRETLTDLVNGYYERNDKTFMSRV